MPWDMDDFELAVAGIESGMELIEVTLQMMKTDLGRLRQVVEDQNREDQSV